MKTIIETIDHKDQRYPTVGDWYFDEHGNLVIRVSKMSDPRYEMLVAVHELVEVLQCQRDGVSQESVDQFDKAFEEKRAKGELKDENAEPGDEPDAPYHEQHCLATSVERLLAYSLGVNWSQYADEVE